MDARVKIAREIVRREMHSYDSMSNAPRYRVIAPTKRAKPDTDQRQSRCAHDIYLHEPCSKCRRSDADCVVYQQAMLSRLKELLK